MQLSPDDQRLLLDLARAAIRKALGLNVTPIVGANAPLLQQKAGCFVSLHDRATHQLRGCVGRLDSNAPLRESLEAAATGSLEDPRFEKQRISAETLPTLQLEISLISPMRQLAHPLSFDLMSEGVFMVFGDRSGCFLPQVARETGWNKQELLDHLATEKLGMTPITWQHPEVRVFAFTSTIIGPEAF